MRKLTMDEVKSRLAEINPSIEILDKEYINSGTKMRCKCKVDGHEWMSTWTNLQQGHGCPKCKTKKIREMLRFDIEHIKLWLIEINPNIEILDNAYINNSTKMKCRCKIDRYEWEVTWGHLSQGKGCPKCAKNMKYTIDKVKNRLAEINPNIKVLDNHYLNNRTKLKCECLVDGHKWEPTWGDLSQGQGCPVCANKNKDGIYNITISERHKEEWLNKHAIVYTIECWNEHERFYKIGIATKSVKHRFKSSKNMPYNYHILSEIHTNKYDATYLEKQLYEQNKQYKYIPQIKFGGYTECFSELVSLPLDTLNSIC